MELDGIVPVKVMPCCRYNMAVGGGEIMVQFFRHEEIPLLSKVVVVVQRGDASGILRNCSSFDNVGRTSRYQGLFLDTFSPDQLNSSWRFSSFFGYCLSFLDIA